MWPPEPAWAQSKPGTTGNHKGCPYEAAGLKNKAQELLQTIEANPYLNPPPYEKLVGDLAGAYSRRINIQHRLVCQVLSEEYIVKVLRLWTHSE